MGHGEHEPGADVFEFPAVGAATQLRRGADGVLRYGDLSPALTELLDLRVHSFANREAVVEVGGPTLTYRELWHSASRIAGGLQGHGIGYGDRVAVHMPTSARWVRAFLGALLSGAVPVLVPEALPAAIAERVIADSRADFVLGPDGPLPDSTAFIDDGAALDDPALLCYTGVRRSMPTGVELSNENLLSAVSSVVGALGLPADGLRNLVLLPLAHASGCVDQLLPTFAVGGTVVLAPGARCLADVLVRERIDTVSGTPRIFAALVPELGARRAGAGVRRISKACHRSERAAAAAPVALTTALRGLFPAANQWSVWGATETSGIGLMVDDTELADAGSTLGFAFGGTELALAGPRARAGHGELLCRGPNVSRRYWNNPDASAARFSGSWFHTGDFVSIDADGLVRVDQGG
ncbi:class I adenylate-forming enzyme family protein [Nocardia alba]|uniref:Acyl-CoA synthetase (AMP-forming)/AMP-acid ligase II n=1 Tax=Nocardia alba TaxID=225051 RepID=A0A4R1G774_9NOCA|nr:AMP-binding protein [Nocardia alba]TCJ99731.1 acyl-CoA synthetase (AMP-forming)/AMP-acid ligase II [Nocardia alba]